MQTVPKLSKRCNLSFYPYLGRLEVRVGFRNVPVALTDTILYYEYIFVSTDSQIEETTSSSSL